MPEDDSKPELPATPAADRSPSDVRTTDPDEIFADWSEMRVGRAILYASVLLSAGAILVLVLILLNVL
jgi:hypothetical protein